MFHAHDILLFMYNEDVKLFSIFIDYLFSYVNVFRTISN